VRGQVQADAPCVARDHSGDLEQPDAQGVDLDRGQERLAARRVAKEAPIAAVLGGALWK
jgi:hypothetical protein